MRSSGKGHGFVLILLAFLYGCAKVPYTGRSQLMMVSQSDEAAIGLDTFGKIKKESKLSTDPKELELVERVGRKIASAVDHPEYNWEFVVIDDRKTVNAFALPGGKVAFYSGILPVCGGESGVAVVMGHEISHVLARHGAERLSQQEILSIGEIGVMAALGVESPAAQVAVSQAYGIGAQVGVLLPFSRAQEAEADHIGLIIMAKAGYDPRAAVDFWKRMERLSGGKSPPALLATHPSDEKRIKKIEEYLPEALEYYNKAANEPAPEKPGPSPGSK